ncbi:diacylglycerol kinase family protein [Mangrovimonas sp. AS39]|uniref:diacylglycerol kinase n=1 Tax=Mangrovimonas futianensis TaxID=2895523 RepID=UPI001E44A436|nr:diacylglycerol kinase family protein [Mangrovimonas futianensis]MCF1192756.1 diacylglycerol kinase family protein [Mangrovimonas futianensis]MCF1196323.1 diacylglycerol kinase family protein [Mangrovimonas futianensis]
MDKKESLLINRLKSIKYAFKGAWILVTTESSIQIQVFIGIIITILGFVFDLSATEWMIQTLTIGIIISIEAINTAIEEIANFVHPQIHPKIGLIKDLAAGAVFIFAITAIIVGCFIYFPKIF